MRNRMVGIAVAAAFVIGLGTSLWSQVEEDSAQKDVPQIRPIPTVPTGEAIRDSMHAKMQLMQKVLEGLVIRDYVQIRDAGASLKKVSLAAPAQVDGGPIDNELYDHFKLEFLRLATQLQGMGEKENLGGAAFVYQNLTANCMACHSYLYAPAAE